MSALRHLTLLDWVAIIAGSWLILGVIHAPAIGRALKRAGLAADPVPAAPPAAPAATPPARSAHDTEWVAPEPLRIRLTDTEARLRCHDILITEGLSS